MNIKILVSIYEECIRKSYFVSKLTSIILKIIREVFKNIYNFAEESFAKQKLLIIMKNLKTPKYCFKHKKEDMVNVKRGHKLCLK